MTADTFSTTRRDPQSDAHRRINASAMKGIRVAAASGVAGRLQDMILNTRGEAGPDGAGGNEAWIDGLVVRVGRKDVRVAADMITACDARGIVVSTEPAKQHVFVQANGELLVLRDLLDGEVIDRPAQRVIRVNDAVLRWDGKRLACVAVDASAAGLCRRLMPHWLADRFRAHTVPWSEIEPVIEPPDGLSYGFSYARLAELHPADIAKLLDHLPYRQGARILCSLEVRLASDTLEEVERRRQPEILEYVPQERTVAILNSMAPDAAADLLADVAPQRSAGLIKLLEPETANNIKLLLSYPRNSAAGLMTTNFVMALRDATVAETMDYVRGQLRRPHLVYYVYVVDNATDRRLQGVLSLRDLILADGKDPVVQRLDPTVHTVHPIEHSKEVARIMGEYNLLALPVIDDLGRMLGLVTVDDVLDLMLPEGMRRHLPRLFS